MTAVGDPPRHALNTQPAPGARPALGRFLRATTTPAKLRLLLAGLVALCLVWGVVAAWVVSQRTAGADDVVSTSETLSLDGQQIYRALSDADATAASAFLSSGLEPINGTARYRGDIAQAAAHLYSATAAAGHSPAARDLATLSAGLPVYTGEVQTARADNRLGLPLGAAYLQEASKLMRGTLLPAARSVSAQADAQLASGQATGPAALPCWYGRPRLRAHRAQRLFQKGRNAGSTPAWWWRPWRRWCAAWLAIPFTLARADLLRARSRVHPVATLARSTSRPAGPRGETSP
jgi:hypothetical protein